MDHVIDSLRRWILVFEERPEDAKDPKAIECIQNAIKELNKYYRDQKPALLTAGFSPILWESTVQYCEN